MFEDRRLRYGVVIATGLTLVLAAAVTAQAPGVVDQTNDPPTGTSYGCGSSGLSLYQGFRPAAGDLVAAELRYRAGGDFPAGGVSLRLRVREGSPTGPVRATAEAAVSGHAPGSDWLARFAVDPPLVLTPGADYVLESVSPAPAGTPAARVASWMGVDGDPYARGMAYGCSGVPADERDYNFITYASASDGPTPTTAAYPGPSPTPRGPVCPHIAGRVPQAAVDAALADPSAVLGYDQLRDPGKPEGPHNPRRTWLSMRRIDAGYHPLYNRLVYKASCP